MKDGARPLLLTHESEERDAKAAEAQLKVWGRVGGGGGEGCLS